MNKKISIVIPVYCNQESLKILFERLILLEKNLKSNYKLATEIIFIDDGSYDNSWDVLLLIKNIRPSTKVIRLTRNFGGVHAVKIGFQNLTGDAFTMLAADLQDPPELILDMANQWLKGNKFVICEREIRNDSFLKILFSNIYYKIIRLLVIKDYPMGGFDMALMDKVFLPYLQKAAKSSFPPILAYWLGFKPFVIKYARGIRMHGKSRWSFKKRLNTFFDVFFGFSINPIRFISIVGTLVSLLSFVYGLFIFFSVFANGIKVPGYTSIMVLISFLLGMIILMLGIIGEYLWRVLDEVNGRPEAVISEIL
jgi:glycosyltransferase involved in cell wall biosynthesis